MDKLIQNFSVKSVADFFKTKISSFSPNSENLDYILNDTDFAHFSCLQKIGEVAFNNSDELIVFACKFQGVLSERSSKKRQFEIAKKVLKEDFKDGAIFIFYDENDCFRFSFIRKNYGNKEQKFTNWKRYTYFVDPARTNKTFKNRINGCNFNSLEDIQEAFSVEKLNKKFYEEIATAFYSLIGGKVSINKKEVSFDSCLQLPSTPFENRKVYQEFAVRLIGRTIFCWFLKNKKSDSGISLIPEEWLSSNMVASVNNDQHNYYHSILEKLFFLVLNKKHEDRKPYVLPNNHEFVPFLNGGLFEAQEDDFFPKDSKGIHSQNFGLNIPNQWFKDFFETLEQYNFTIDENTINDFEVSIDPEMLGTIFENLLAEIDPDTEKSARKSTGSFYTPREIVDYMVEQSLLQYIKTKTNIEDEEQLEVLLKDDTENPFNEKQTITILEALSEVKILDPACGSGAFPMGVLHKIIALLKKLDKNAVWWKAKQLEKIDNALVRKAMETKLNQANSDYIRKLGVIQHSIYGVDIQPIAAEISKLRSFLSLIIDENIDDKAENRGIEPLPNLEFKFVTANTLIGLEKGNTVGNDMTFDFGETSDLQNQLQHLRNSYLQATPQEKDKLKQQFEKLQTKIYKQEVLNAGGIGSKRAQQLVAWKPFSNESSTWFDPDWMFGVEKFDVVIGNPPYIQLSKSNNISDDQKKYLKTRYKTSAGRLNAFIFFIHNALEKLNSTGQLVYIIPNTILTQEYYSYTREIILKKFHLIEIVNYESMPFENAVVENVTLFIQARTNDNLDVKITSDNLKEVKLIKEVNHNDFLFQDNFSFNFKSNNTIDKIFNLDGIVTLGTICNVNQGIALKGDKSLSLREHNANKKFYKLLDGKNINKNLINWTGVYLDYSLDRIHSCKRKDIFESKEKLFFRRVSENLVFAYDDEQYFALNTLVVVNSKPGFNFKIKYLLAILNSSLVNYVYKNKYKSTKKVFSEIQANSVEKLPIRSLTENEQNKFVNLSNLIIENRKEHLETKELEAKIDIMVYKLYELTYDEVLIVEPEFGLSEQEYDTYKIEA
jgi:adenine-specific DNA-methyltransferase